MHILTHKCTLNNKKIMHKRIHTHTYKHVHAHTPTHKTHSRVHAHTYMHTVYTHVHSVRTCTHIRPALNTHTHLHMYTHLVTHIQWHANTYTNTHTRTRYTHTVTHTICTHTHLRVIVVWEVPSIWLFCVGYLGRAVAIVIVVATDNVPPGLERVSCEHILKHNYTLYIQM